MEKLGKVSIDQFQRKKVKEKILRNNKSDSQEAHLLPSGLNARALIGPK